MDLIIRHWKISIILLSMLAACSEICKGQANILFSHDTIQADVIYEQFGNGIVRGHVRIREPLMVFSNRETGLPQYGGGILIDKRDVVTLLLNGRVVEKKILVMDYLSKLFSDPVERVDPSYLRCVGEIESHKKLDLSNTCINNFFFKLNIKASIIYLGNHRIEIPDFLNTNKGCFITITTPFYLIDHLIDWKIP